MSDLLGIGLSGLNAYRAALSAVGENVANAETPGYARRTVRLTPALTVGQSDPFYREQVRFGGVSAAAVVRSWDEFRAGEARHAAAGLGRASVREQWFTSIESALEDGTAGVGARITSFFNAADTLAAAPGDLLNRNRVLMALEDVAGSFRTTADALRRVQEGIGTAAALDVDQLNDRIEALARNNQALLTAPPGGTAKAALEDERDRLIDEIAGSVGVRVTIGDRGLATVALADPPGTAILSDGNVGSFSLATGTDGRLSLQLTTSTGTSAVSPSSGRLAGFIDAAATTADRRAALDTLAADFAADINAWSAAGLDRSGAAGPPLLEVTAGALSMRAPVTDPARVPAASSDGRPNGNLLALAPLRGDGGAERRWTGIVAGHAQQLAAARAEHSASKAWRDNSFAALDETTGVDLDREAADLLRYQQAYSAAARIVQVGRETVDALLAMF